MLAIVGNRDNTGKQPSGRLENKSLASFLSSPRLAGPSEPWWQEITWKTRAKSERDARR